MCARHVLLSCPFESPIDLWLQSRSPQSLTAGMSLAESIEIQRRAAERERKELERKTARLQVDAKRPTNTGELLRGALGVDAALSEYM